MEGSADIGQGLAEVNQELHHVERQIERLLQKQQRLRQRKDQLELQASRLQELSLQGESTDWDKSDYPWSSKLHSLSESVFGIGKFRPLQEKTMNASLSGRDVIILMPTGGGKSLCYQLPALLNKGLTLVVSPLVSLMEDQTMALDDLGVSAAMLCSNTSPESAREIHRQMVDNRSGLKLLYVTPEKIAKSKRFMACLEKAYKAKLLTRIAIDEVHCCSQWGHDFRPDYKILGLLKRQFTETPILGLTATATMDVLEDVKGILGLQGCQVFRAGFNRPNLFYEVRPKPSKQEDFIEELIRLIDGEFKEQSGIIYCFSRRDSENLAEKLKKHGIRAHPYHAMLDAQYRSSVHKGWKENNIQVVVATVAFGMGIDKPDVRFVIHHSISKSMENYYQESGRAGRDDQPAKCIVFYGLADVFRQSTMVVTEQTGQEKLYNMVAYCITPATCRRRLIGNHFGERWKDDSGCGNTCDACRSGAQGVEKDMVLHLQRIYKILDHSSKADKRITALKLADELRSKKGAAPLDKDLAKTMKGDDYEYLIAHFLLQGYLREDFHFTPYNTISYMLPGPKSRLVNANPHRSINILFKSDGGRPARVKGQGVRGEERAAGCVKAQKGSASAAATTSKADTPLEEGVEAGGSSEGSVQSGKAKKRKMEEVVIDLCSDGDSEESQEEFVSTTKDAKRAVKTAKSSTMVRGPQERGKSCGGKKKPGMKQVHRDEKSVKCAKSDTTRTSALDARGVIDDGSVSADRTDVGKVAGDTAATSSISKISGGIALKHESSSQSLAESKSDDANSANQGPSMHVRDIAAVGTHDFNRPSCRDETKSTNACKGQISCDVRSVQSGMSQALEVSPHGRKVSPSPSSAISPSSDFDLDLRTVYTKQLMSLGSDGESFNRENSSFTMSTSFSGSEDGTGSTRREGDGAGATARGRRKGTMRRTDSMDNYDCDESVGEQEDYETLERVYSKQLKRLDDSL